jgi:hypothetical protein
MWLPDGGEYIRGVFIVNVDLRVIKHLKPTLLDALFYLFFPMERTGEKMIQKMEEDAPYELYQEVWEAKQEDEEITPSHVLARAKEILESFNQFGQELYERIDGTRGREAQTAAVRLKMELEQFVKKFESASASPIQLMKKDAPYELKERVIERIRIGEKLNPEFVLSQAREMIAEFCKEGNDSYEDISGDNGEEAQSMANELKVSLERFVQKYERHFHMANIPGISSEESFGCAPSGRSGEGSKDEKAPLEKSSFFMAAFKEANTRSPLLRPKTHQYPISP